MDHRIHSSAQPARCRAITRQIEDELQHEIAIAGDIEAVGGDGVEAELLANAVAVDGQRRAGQGGGAERQNVDALAAIGQAFAVALIFLDVGQEVMRRQHRLGPLQVRVAGQDHVALALGGVDQGRLQFDQAAVDAVDGVAHPELDIGDDLIVAAAAGVQLAADVAEPRDQGLLDVRVDVFELDRKRKLAAFDLAADVVEGGDDLRRLRRRSSRPTSASMRAWAWLARMSCAVEPVVEADRLGEGFDAIVGVAGEAAAPGFLGHAVPPCGGFRLSEKAGSPGRVLRAKWRLRRAIVDVVLVIGRGRKPCAESLAS